MTSRYLIGSLHRWKQLQRAEIESFFEASEKRHWTERIPRIKIVSVREFLRKFLTIHFSSCSTILMINQRAK